MDQNSNNNIIWGVLAKQAGNISGFASDLQRLVFEHPQSGLLQALSARAGAQNGSNAAAYFDSRVLYKVVNRYDSLLPVSAEQIISKNIVSSFEDLYEVPKLYQETTLPPIVEFFKDEEPASEINDPIADHQPETEAEPVAFQEELLEASASAPQPEEVIKHETPAEQEFAWPPRDFMDEVDHHQKTAALTDTIPVESAISPEHHEEPALADAHAEHQQAHDHTKAAPIAEHQEEPAAVHPHDEPEHHHTEAEVPAIAEHEEEPAAVHVHHEAGHHHSEEEAPVVAEHHLIEPEPVTPPVEDEARHQHYFHEPVPAEHQEAEAHHFTPPVENVAAEETVEIYTPFTDIPPETKLVEAEPAPLIEHDQPVAQTQPVAAEPEFIPFASEPEQPFAHFSPAAAAIEPVIELSDEEDITESEAAAKLPWETFGYSADNQSTEEYIPFRNKASVDEQVADALQHEPDETAEMPYQERVMEKPAARSSSDLDQFEYEWVLSPQDQKFDVDESILDNLAAEYFVFDRSFNQGQVADATAVTAEKQYSPETALSVTPQLASSRIEQPFKTEQVIKRLVPEPVIKLDISRYNDEKMPYSFMWWLDKTRKEYGGLYQPFVKVPEAPEKKTVEKRIKDELQQQYYENIFHLTSADEIQQHIAPQTEIFNPESKEDIIIKRFIKEKPQISPPMNEKLDTENKAKRSSEDTDEIVTETLARIYTDQMLYPKAIATYKKLMLKYPEKSRYFASQIQNLENKTN